MPSVDEIKALVASMPELDNPPPPPPEKKPDPTKPADGAKPADGTKPADGAKPTDAPKPTKPPEPVKPPEQKPRQEKGKLTGPAWPAAQKVYDTILSGGKESVGVVLDMVKENDVGPAYKPRYVAHALAVYVMGPGKDAERAAVTEALVSRLMAADKPKGIRGFYVRTLQQCGNGSHAAALAPLLAEEELADPAAQAMVTLGGDSAALLAKALPDAKGRGRLAILQALGGLRDTAATEALIKEAEDSDEKVRLTAIWALARGGDPRAVDAVLKASDATESWPRSQATRAAFALAEGLAAAGKKDDAAKVYRHLREARTADHERHVKEAAERAWEGLK
jgi:hypothetical protein